MRLVGLHVVERFVERYPKLRKPVERWIRLIRENSFRNVVDLRRLFPSADPVGNKVVFNVGGNKIRAITVIEYSIQQVLITDVLTHKEYDKEKWKD